MKNNIYIVIFVKKIFFKYFLFYFILFFVKLKKAYIYGIVFLGVPQPGFRT